MGGGDAVKDIPVDKIGILIVKYWINVKLADVDNLYYVHV